MIQLFHLLQHQVHLLRKYHFQTLKEIQSNFLQPEGQLYYWIFGLLGVHHAERKILILLQFITCIIKKDFRFTRYRLTKPATHGLKEFRMITLINGYMSVMSSTGIQSWFLFIKLNQYLQIFFLIG